MDNRLMLKKSQEACSTIQPIEIINELVGSHLAMLLQKPVQFQQAYF